MPKTRKPACPPKAKPAAPVGPSSAVVTITHYTDKNGHDYFKKWTLGLRDDKAGKAIDRRILQLKDGNFGDAKPLREGVRELRVDVGPGYRVYTTPRPDGPWFSSCAAATNEAKRATSNGQ